jgi:hypothetical protein
MAKLVFGLNQSLDGYVDQEFAPGFSGNVVVSSINAGRQHYQPVCADFVSTD